jgi:hypothetical protein
MFLDSYERVRRYDKGCGLKLTASSALYGPEIEKKEKTSQELWKGGRTCCVILVGDCPEKLPALGRILVSI